MIFAELIPFEILEYINLAFPEEVLQASTLGLCLSTAGLFARKWEKLNPFLYHQLLLMDRVMLYY